MDSYHVATALHSTPRMQPCDPWSGGCGQVVTQMCCHMVNVLNDLPDTHRSIIRTSQPTKLGWLVTAILVTLGMAPMPLWPFGQATRLQGPPS